MWRKGHHGSFLGGDLDIQVVVAMREPNYFRILWKRPLNMRVGNTSLQLPVGQTWKMAAAWSIVDHEHDTPEGSLRGERAGDRPVWKNFTIMNVAGSPEDTSDVVQVKNDTEVVQSIGQGVSFFNHSLGLTISGINYCQRDGYSPLENIELVFGFGRPQRRFKIGQHVAMHDSKCGTFKLPLGDCIATMTIGGTHSMQRLLMTTKQGFQYVIGRADAAIYHWDTFESNKSCLTGMFGVTYNTGVISVGFYFNPQVLPDGKLYLPYEPHVPPNVNTTSGNVTTN